MTRAIWNGHVIADSDDTIVVGGNHYFPPDSVHTELLQPSTTQTRCIWKGRATSRTIVVDGRANPDAAFLYERPTFLARKIQGHIAFWHGVTIETS